MPLLDYPEIQALLAGGVVSPVGMNTSQASCNPGHAGDVQTGDDPAATRGVAPPRPGATAANFDGFIALLLISLFLGFIWSLRAPRRITGDFLFESIAMLLVYSGAWLFAIGGTRRGAGANRVAAIASLMLLSASVALVLAVFIRSLCPP